MPISTEKILVTGATGFIGRRVVAELRARGVAVTALVRGSAAVVPDGVTALRGELSAFEALRGPLRRAGPFDALLHLAWITTPGLYLESRENLLHLSAGAELLAWASANVGRVVATGTCFEYAFDRPGPVREDARTEARHLYSATKLALHGVGSFLCARAGVPFTWARLFYPYGPGEHEARLFPSLRATLANGGSFRLRGDGSALRDFIHVDDVARALALLLGAGLAGPVNVGTGRGISVGAAALAIARTLGAEKRVSFAPPGAPPGEPAEIVADAGLLRGLGWEPLEPAPG